MRAVILCLALALMGPNDSFGQDRPCCCGTKDSECVGRCQPGEYPKSCGTEACPANGGDGNCPCEDVFPRGPKKDKSPAGATTLVSADGDDDEVYYYSKGRVVKGPSSTRAAEKVAPAGEEKDRQYYWYLVNTVRGMDKVPYATVYELVHGGEEHVLMYVGVKRGRPQSYALEVSCYDAPAPFEKGKAYYLDPSGGIEVWYPDGVRKKLVVIDGRPAEQDIVYPTQHQASPPAPKAAPRPKAAPQARTTTPTTTATPAATTNLGPQVVVLEYLVTPTPAPAAARPGTIDCGPFG